MSTIYVYVSSLFDARSERRTGIPRIEYEIAREFVGRGAKIITFNRLLRKFVVVDFEAQIAPLVRAQDESADAKLSSRRVSKLRFMGGLAARPLLPLATAVGGQIGVGIAAVVSPALSDDERRRVAARLNLASNARASIQYSSALARSRRGLLSYLRIPKPAKFEANDVVVVPGIIWKPEPLEELFRLNRDVGVRVMPYIHDLIPIRRPEFLTDDAGVARFRRHLGSLMRCSACLCVNSDYVAEDLRSFIRESGSPVIPVVKVAPCAAIDPGTPAEMSERLVALGLRKQFYALYVSTLNPRKNHIGIYLLWRRLVELCGEAIPPLVFAGQRGWNTDDILKQMSRDDAMWNRYVHFIEAPTDGEISALYRDCAFTVYPSLQEGWGLAITESLAFGKPCLAADNTSLREAGQGLAIHIDHLDGSAWIAELLRLSKDMAYREKIASTIICAYRHRSWVQVANELHDVVLKLMATAAEGQSSVSDAPQ